MPLIALVTASVGTAAGAIGYCAAKLMGSYSVCAAGRSPLSLALILGMSAAVAAFALTRTAQPPPR